MSVSLWKWAEPCDHRNCPGDCDFCDFDPEEAEEEEPMTKEKLLGLIKEAEQVYRSYDRAANYGGNYGPLLSRIRGIINGYKLELEYMERKEKNEH